MRSLFLQFSKRLNLRRVYSMQYKPSSCCKTWFDLAKPQLGLERALFFASVCILKTQHICDLLLQRRHGHRTVLPKKKSWHV